MTWLEVLLECTRCGERLQVDVNGQLTESGWHIPRGTLHNDWALRWANSHQQPRARVLSA